MRLKDLLELAENPNHIEGIYNYCDRWCERCPFTSRCLLFATEEADTADDPVARDITNAAFWDKLSSIFRETHEMIAELAQESGAGIDASPLPEEETLREQKREETLNHPVAKAAEEYVQMAQQWFDFQQLAIVSDEHDEVNQDKRQDASIDQYLEVIRWYQFFIAVKIIRGLTSRIDEDTYIEDADPRDSDGSIKVALIAIDRSIAAWSVVRDLENNDSLITHLLLHLEKLRLSVEAEFPCARDFVRAGFDEELSALH